jgi:GNAT superfamily N-acetyltransferase
VAYFGLLPAFHGQGLGGFLLTHALRRAFELAPRVCLHTCTLDGPAALPNYQARGLRPFRTQTL